MRGIGTNRTHPRRRARGGLAAAVVAVVLVAAACGSGHDDPADAGAPPPGEEPALRVDPAMAWLGDGRLFVSGGRHPETGEVLGTSEIIDVAEGAATPLPSAPVDGVLVDPSAATFGSSALVGGVVCGEPGEGEGVCEPGTAALLTYDSDAGEWTDVAPPVDDARLSTRHTAFVLGTTSQGAAIVSFGPLAGTYWIAAAPGDEWRPLPSPPLELPPATLNDVPFAGSLVASCLAGDRLVAVEVISADQDYGTVGSQIDGMRVHVLDTADAEARWRAVSDLDVGLRAFPVVSCLDRSVVATSGADASGGVHVLDLDGEVWSEAPPAPGAPMPYPGRLAAGEELVFVPGQPDDDLLRLDPRDATWTRIAGSRGSATRLVVGDGAAYGFNESPQASIAVGRLFSIATRP